MSALRLLTILLFRELGGRSFLAIVVAAAAGVAAAHETVARHSAGSPSSAGIDLLGRFHVTMLYVAALLLLLRIPLRRQEDHDASWLDPWCAAGGRRIAYPMALWGSTSLAMWLLFAAGASAFALSVWVLGHSADLLWPVTRLLPVGAVTLLAVGGYATIGALLVRNAFGSILASLLLLAAPWYVGVSHAVKSGGAPTPLLIEMWVKSYPPPLWPADSMKTLFPQLLYIAVAGAVMAALSRRLVARRA